MVPRSKPKPTKNQTPYCNAMHCTGPTLPINQTKRNPKSKRMMMHVNLHEVCVSTYRICRSTEAPMPGTPRYLRRNFLIRP